MENFGTQFPQTGCMPNLGMPGMTQGYNQPMMGYQQQPQVGYQQPVYPHQMQQTQDKAIGQNWLSEEEIAQMRQSLPEFNLAITDEELRVARCNHNYNGVPCVQKDPLTGEWECQLCHVKIKALPFTPEQAEEITDNFKELLEQSKMFWGSALPRETGREFYQIIPLCGRVPKMYKMSVDVRNKMSKANGWVNTMQPCSLLGAMMQGVPIGTPMQQQPVYPAGYAAAPMMHGMPMAGVVPQQMPGMAQAPMQPNPMYASPMGQQVPTTTYVPNAQSVNFNLSPQGAAAPQPVPQQPAQPVAQPAAQPATPPNGVNVTANFTK